MSASIQRLLKMQRFTRATERYYGHRNRRRHALDRLEVIAPHHAVSVNGIEYELPRAAVDNASRYDGNVFAQVTALDTDPAYAAALKSLKANYDRLCATFFCGLFNEPVAPQGTMTATKLISAIREAELKIGKLPKSPSYGYWHEASLSEGSDHSEVRPLLSRRADIKQHYLVHTAGFVKLHLLADSANRTPGAELLPLDRGVAAVKDDGDDAGFQHISSSTSRCAGTDFQPRIHSRYTL